ncbi:MAG: phosphoribosylamine--glycine ligase [Candidatus Diapherotrites archaeon]|nr:phosphoribosylamine--glycine ligase [Candidatus Diapherotrites archaeon]
MEPKNFLFFSYDALINDIVWQVKKEGHNVKFYIENPNYKTVGDGFVEKTDDWKKEVDWADVIVFDDVLGHGTIAQKLREEGKAVVGGTIYTDKLEDDRAFGQEELKKHGIPILPYQLFTSFDEAIEFVENNPGKYVIKPSGEAANLKRLLFVGEDEEGKDVLRVLHAYKKVWSSQIKEFALQKKISGVEVAVGAFFNGKEFVYPLNINFEHKKLFPGNIGPATGEMGTTMFWSMPNRLFNLTLRKFEDTLRKEKFVGYIDLNCIVNANGIYPLEFTTRFGYPTISIQQEGMITPIGEFLYAIAKGESIKFRTKTGFQVGVRIVVPPFPFDDDDTFETYSRDSVIMFKKPDREGIHLEDVRKLGEEWIVAGHSGVILIVVGTGQTMRQAQEKAYSRIKNILIPNMYYRKDIGNRWFEDTDKMHNWGYLREN